MKKDIFVGKKIHVTHCTASGKIFQNLTDGSEHEIIEKPYDEPERNANGKRGFWVMGVGEPVMLLFNEIVENLV